MALPAAAPESPVATGVIPVSSGAAPTDLITPFIGAVTSWADTACGGRIPAGAAVTDPGLTSSDGM